MDLAELQDNQSIQYCFHSDNISCIKQFRSKSTSAILYIFGAAAVMVTFSGNLVVIISISHFKQLHTPTNFLILSLAAADFLIGVAIMPFMLIQSIETCWYFGDVICYIYTGALSMLTTVSVFSLVLIAIDRYFAVSDPLLYSTKITVHSSWAAVGTIWLLTLLYACIYVLSHGSTDGDSGIDTCPGDCLLVHNSTWAIVDPICGFILPVFIMAALYTKVFIVATRHAHAISAQKKAFEEGKKAIKKKSERKAAKTLGIVMVVFLLCLSPMYFFLITNLFTNFSAPPIVPTILIWLVYLNSTMNPIMYALFYPWFQKSVKLLVTFKICSTESSLTNLLPDH
ncbi:trace amine-associated receptor 13c-like [Erpetoichthys calabaricus]|uniref:trace amine-associated receptor 13c-like n=1 Tax=Erpetoichthys calabaricus TaxID=27687 RepID=UPI00223434B7|nr:trace amine-associated receptor 13c-like [Erpetoichthys calabaricus]